MEYSLFFSVTKEKVHYHLNSKSLYHITLKNLERIMIFNEFKYVSFKNNNLSNEQKLYIFQELTKLNVEFVPLKDGFYIKSNI